MARWDLVFVALAGAHGVALAAWPAIPVIAFGMWWNANTIAHNFIHRPFFKTPSANLAFSAYLSVLLGVPQSLWRDRHLAHHRGVAWRFSPSPQFIVEAALVCGLWTALAVDNPIFFTASYVPAYALGLMLCGLQGHYEHVRGTTSHYGAIYNALCFNDGYHVEHHANPGVPWMHLRERLSRDARSSRWPPLLRWMDDLGPHLLERLERLVLRFPLLQRPVLRAHRQAFAALVPRLQPIRRIAVVGGGLFPRTALVLRDLLPEADIVVVDASAENLDTARSMMDGAGVHFMRGVFSVPGDDFSDFDVLVIPLSFKGNRDLVYERPPTRALLVHDWIWHRRGEGRIVSLALLKRLNLVTQ